MSFHDIEDERTAREFGHLVSRTVILAAARLGIGIDPGNDRPRGGVGKIFSDLVAAQGRKVMPNVHGLMVYECEGNEIFFAANAVGNVTLDPSAFVDVLNASFQDSLSVGEREKTALALIALSKTAGDPLAEGALCVSAVEYLSTDEPWTQAQLDLLAILKTDAAACTRLPETEAKEVADALNSVFKSIRQSIKRRVFALGLTRADWTLFDDLYTLRSGLFHGSIIGRDRHADFAAKARHICTRIVMAAVDKARAAGPAPLSEGRVGDRG